MPEFFPKTLSAVTLAVAMLAAPAAQAGGSQIPFGEARGWSVIAFLDGTTFNGCAASHQQLDGQTGIAMSADGNWLLAFEMPTPQGVIPAQMNIDGRVWNFQATGEGNRVSFGPSLEMIAMVRAGHNLTISVQGASYTATLIGSSAAMNMVQDCVNRRGGGGGGAGAAGK